MDVDHSSPLSVRDYRARHHIDRALKSTHNKILLERGPDVWGPGGVRLERPLGDDDEFPVPPKFDLPSHPTDTTPKVCIVGAGAAGHFTAMLINYLNTNVQGFNVQYDIFEAEATVGGRLYTYNFSKDLHGYYDVGTMRFLDSDIMQRLG